MTVPAPLPSVLQVTGKDISDTKEEIVTAPPLVLGPPKRYDDTQIEKVKTLKKFIEDASKLMINDAAVERYLKQIQSALYQYNNDNDKDTFALFELFH